MTFASFAHFRTIRDSKKGIILTKKVILLSAIIMVLAVSVASASTEIIPCAVGNKWDYDCYKLLRANVRFDGHTVAFMNDASSGSSVYQVVSSEAKSTPPVFSYTETNDMESVHGASDNDHTELKLVTDKAGLKILSSISESADEKDPDKQTYDPPLLYYGSEAETGKSWEVGTMRDRDTKTYVTAKSVGRETVTVPAGTFKNCLKVVYTSDEISGTMDVWNKTFNITSGHSRGIYWVADGIGVVKELEVATSQAETPGPTGKSVTVEASSCTVSELKPGFTVKK